MPTITQGRVLAVSVSANSNKAFTDASTQVSDVDLDSDDTAYECHDTFLNVACNYMLGTSWASINADSNTLLLLCTCKGLNPKQILLAVHSTVRHDVAAL